MRPGRILGVLFLAGLMSPALALTHSQPQATPTPTATPSPSPTPTPKPEKNGEFIKSGAGQIIPFQFGQIIPLQQDANSNMKGDVEILSDTRGVDFGPYLQRARYRIKTNWYNLIPEVAKPPMMKKGSLIIQFSILKSGNVAGMRLQLPSGDVQLDRAAWGGITNSDPFEPLPKEFPGEFLVLRIKFLYNTASISIPRDDVVPRDNKVQSAPKQ